MSQCSIATMAALEAEYSEAMRLGDRAKAAGILKRLFDLIGNIDPEKLEGFIGLLMALFGIPAPPASSAPQALGTSGALTVGEAEAAGIATNPQLWIQLLTMLFQIIKAMRSQPTETQAADETTGDV